jgi:hypothetical protein
MCTAVVSIEPDASFPVLLAGVRDEFHDRSWVPPGRHWPDSPKVIGGLDLQAGGTWLAVDAGVPRFAAVLNGIPVDRGAAQSAPAREDRLSRGGLPLRFAADGELGEIDSARYEPFYLVYGTLDQVRLLSWDGQALTDRRLEPGLHMVTNLGLAGPDLREGFGMEEINARIGYFQPRLAAAARPTPRTGSTEAAWGAWAPLIEGDGLDPRDPRALVVRQDFDGRPTGTTSITLLALGRDRVRYDFNAAPGVRGQWSTVE